MIQRLAVILLIVIIVLGGGYYAYQRLVPPPAEEAQGPVYSTRPVTRGDISVGVETTGPLNPSRGGGIQAPGGPEAMRLNVSYLLEELLVQPGDAVSQGQLIARLSAPSLETQMETLTEQLQADREALADLLGVPVAQVERANPAGGITLRAPIDGRVTGLAVTEGKELKQGEIVARVVDDSRFRLVAKLTPAEFQRVKPAERVLLRFGQFDSALEGRVTDINPSPVPEPSSALDPSSPGGAGSAEGEQYQFVYWVTIEGENPGLVRPGLIATIGLTGKTAEGEGAKEKLDVFQATWLRYPAKVEGFVKEERVLSPADVIATRVFVHEMETVKAGDPLVSLAGEDTREMIAEKLDKIRKQEAELRQLEAQMGTLEVRAPMDGVVADLAPDKQPGATVRPGEWFGSVFNTADMQMWAQVDDVDVLLVKQGAPVRVTVDALPGKALEGSVMNVSPMGVDQNGITRFSVNIQVKGTPELRPGMQAKAYIDAGSARNVLLVPLEAIFEEDGQTKVEVLQPDGTPKVVAVQLGLMNDKVAEVKSGLEEGQLVITGSTADILPSQRIQGQNSLLPGRQQGNGQNQPGNGGGTAAPAPAAPK